MATTHPSRGDAPLRALRFAGAEPVDLDAVATRFGRNLRRERRRAELSQEELAQRSALHRTEISLLERGGRLPRIDTVLKLAGGLEADPAALLSGVTWHPSSGSVTVRGTFFAGPETP